MKLTPLYSSHMMERGDGVQVAKKQCLCVDRMSIQVFTGLDLPAGQTGQARLREGAKLLPCTQVVSKAAPFLLFLFTHSSMQVVFSVVCRFTGSLDTPRTIEILVKRSGMGAHR